MEEREAFKNSKLGGLKDYLPTCSYETVRCEVRKFIGNAKRKGYSPLPLEVKVLLCHALKEHQLRYILYAYWFVDHWFLNKHRNQSLRLSDNEIHCNTYKLMCVDMYLTVFRIPKDLFCKMEESCKTSSLHEMFSRRFTSLKELESSLWKYVKPWRKLCNSMPNAPENSS